MTAAPRTPSDFELVIGLEVHAQLLTRTKLFCGCETSFGDPPNTHTCPVCLGLPGALPVLNAEAVRMAAAAALALGCEVHRESVFARKNYFYPDLPKGYQISQYERPIATGGQLEIDSDTRGRVRVGITRLHIEEDAGKSLHGVGDLSIVDLNRAGTPLVEIVSEPDLRSAGEAAEYMKRLREVLLALGVNDGNLEQGSFRCDVNLSVRPRGSERLGVRAELKNLNSFRFVAEAVEIEARRQISTILSGGVLRQETRGYDPDRRETYLLRAKEGDAGYRYFPDPDLPTLRFGEAWLDAVRGSLPELPQARRARYVAALGLAPAAAAVLTSHPRVSELYEQALAAWRAEGGGADPVKLANFVQAEVLRDVRTAGLEATLPLSPAHLAELLALVAKGTISGKQAKEVYAAVQGTGRSPATHVAEAGLAVMSDRGALEAMARELVAANPKQAGAYRAGKTALLGFFVGQMMKQTGGSADPGVVNDVLKAALAAE